MSSFMREFDEFLDSITDGMGPDLPTHSIDAARVGWIAAIEFYERKLKEGTIGNYDGSSRRYTDYIQERK